jgi:6-phosphogluconolactonase
MSDHLVYIGTYTGGDSEGIYVYRLDAATGALSHVSTRAGMENPSFLDISPDRRFLYAIGEVGAVDGKPGGAVAAFAIDQQSGALTHLNTESTVGPGPCHLSIDATGKYVLVANYGGGSVAMVPVQDDGSLGAAADFVQHEGSSVNANRQQEPHAHSINVAPNNKHAFAPDLGIDKILIYQIDRENGKLVPNDPPSVSVDPGEGPRHFDFHPNGKYAYVINEIGNTIVSYTYDAENGHLQATGSVSTLPGDFDGVSHTADIHVHPNGKFLYGSNRGHDSLVICAIDESTGQLEVVGFEPTGGKNPRNFGIDPTGSYLLAANQDTGDIHVFRIDGDTGKLSKTEHVAQVPKAVCLKFVPAFS